MAVFREVIIKLLLTVAVLIAYFQHINGNSTVPDQTTETETNVDDAFNPSTITTVSFTEATEEHTTELVDNVVTKETILPTEVESITTRKKEPVSPYTFPLWDASERLCLLAKFQAYFTIAYYSKGGEEVVSLELPEDVTMTGKCADHTPNPLLRISWDELRLLLIFSMVSNDSSPRWALTTLNLAYNTADPIFDGATNVGKKTAESQNLHVFETPLGKSYYCPSSEVIVLYGSKKKVATVKFHNIQLQPFGIKNEDFSPVYRCNQVTFSAPEEPFVQDETVPIAVGLTLAILTLGIVLGFSIYRAYTVRKVDYNTME